MNLGIIRLWITISFCVISVCSAAQVENMLRVPYAQRQKNIDKLCDSIFYNSDSVSAFRLADEIAAYARENNDDTLLLHINLYKLFHVRHYNPSQVQRISSQIQELIGRAEKLHLLKQEIDCRTFLAIFYWDDLKDYERSLEVYNDIDRLQEKMPEGATGEKQKAKYNIANAHFYFRDYRKAIQYFKEASSFVPLSEYERYWYRHSLNNIGVAYQELGMLDSADVYHRRLYQHSIESGDSIWIGISKASIGRTEYLQGLYEKAIDDLSFSFILADHQGDLGLAGGILMNWASACLKLQNVSAAIPLIQKAKEYVWASNRHGAAAQLYPLVSKMYAIQGNPKMAALYVDSTVIMLDSMHRQFSGLMLARVAQKESMVEERVREADIENRKRMLTFKFYGFLVVMILAFGVTIYVYRLKRRQHREQQAFKDQQLKDREYELGSARAQLIEFTERIAEKNELLEQLEQQKGNSKWLEELEQSVILTGQDWGRFRDLFEKVHPGFLQRLNEKISGATPAEVRLLALSKLNFSNKEMASALGVTPQAIRVTWHRLRKKANLPEELTIEDLVGQI
jgi:tetratricopeptide (TPR) repeat protein/DNA-binding CsgD family transcriptional regulator